MGRQKGEWKAGGNGWKCREWQVQMMIIIRLLLLQPWGVGGSGCGCDGLLPSFRHGRAVTS